MNLNQIIGHFHPVVVHLPIGILLLGLCFEMLSTREKFQYIQAAVPLILLLGAISATISCITGYFLSQSGDYEAELLGRHQWLSISVAALSFVFYYLKKRNNRLVINVLSAVLFLGIATTGHLGGSLTHGSDYLFKAFQNTPSQRDSYGAVSTPLKDAELKLVPDALVFKDVMQPIFKEKCSSCHGATKQKGKLRLDEADFIFKGGEDGLALIVGKPDESDMIKRMLLPLSHKDHMPPKEKKQVSANELDLIQWWILNGADIHKTVKELPAFQGEITKTLKETPNYIPDAKVSEPNQQAINALQKLNIVVVPVGENQNFLSVNFINQNDIAAAKPFLQTLSKNIIWLKLSNTKIVDTSFSFISNFDNLTKLFVDNTVISDAGLKPILNLKNLVFLNLVGTKVTSQGVLTLKNLPKLKKLYLYQSAIKSEEFANLQAQLSNIEIDTGGYKVPNLVSDTARLKPPPPKK